MRRASGWSSGTVCPVGNRIQVNSSSTSIYNRSSKPARLTVPRRAQPSQAETALTWFERAMALQPDSPTEARRAYQEALRLQLDFVEAHINLGQFYHDAGEITEAETCYRRALNVGPHSALAHLNLGVVLEDRQHKCEASAALQRHSGGRRIFGKRIVIWPPCPNSSGVDVMRFSTMPPVNASDDPRATLMNKRHQAQSAPDGTGTTGASGGSGSDGSEVIKQFRSERQRLHRLLTISEPIFFLNGQHYTRR